MFGPDRISNKVLNVAKVYGREKYIMQTTRELACSSSSALQCELTVAALARSGSASVPTCFIYKTPDHVMGPDCPYFSKILQNDIARKEAARLVKTKPGTKAIRQLAAEDDNSDTDTDTGLDDIALDLANDAESPVGDNFEKSDFQ